MYAVSSLDMKSAIAQRVPRRGACPVSMSAVSMNPIITKLAIRLPLAARCAAPLGPLNVVTGANGSGKSSLYRALRLLADIAQGRIIQSLAAEGGLHSTLWAGPESLSRAVKRGDHPVQGTVRKNPISLKLGFAGRTTVMPSISACRCRARMLFDAGPRDQDREPVDRRDPRPRQRLRSAQRAVGPHPCRFRRMAAGFYEPRAVRQHDDPLQRSARGA